MNNVTWEVKVVDAWVDHCRTVARQTHFTKINDVEIEFYEMHQRRFWVTIHSNKMFYSRIVDADNFDVAREAALKATKEWWDNV